jgi:putative transposase
MRPSKFTNEDIVRALRAVKAGTPAVQVCRKLGITETTFYRWRNQHSGTEKSEGREVLQLRDENQRLKQLVANFLLDKEASAGVRGKKQ